MLGAQKTWGGQKGEVFLDHALQTLGKRVKRHF